MERKIKTSDIVRDDNGVVEVNVILDDNNIIGTILTRLPDDKFKYETTRSININNILGHTSPIKTIKDGRLKQYKNK